MGIELVMYEIWSTDDKTHIVDVCVRHEADAHLIANALGGVAHQELFGIMVPDESYLK